MVAWASFPELLSISFGLLIGGITLINIRVGIIGLILMGPFSGIIQHQMFGIKALNAFNFTFILLVIKVFTYKLFNQRNKVKFTKIHLIILLYIIITFIAVWRWSARPIYVELIDGWLMYFFKPLQWIIIFYIIKNSIRNERDIKYYLISMLVVTFISSSHIIINLVSNSDVYYIFSSSKVLNERVHALPVFGQKNEYGAFYVCILMFFFPILNILENKTQKMSLFFILAIALIVIFVSLSRAAWLALLLGLIYYLWHVNKRIIPLLVVIAVIAWELLLPKFVIERALAGFDRDTAYIYSLTDITFLNSVLSGRIYINWEPAFKEFINNPLMGGGYYACEKYGIFSNYHNQFIAFLADMGIIGFSIFIWLLIIIWKRVRFINLTINNRLFNTLSFSFQCYFITFLTVNLTAQFFNRFDQLQSTFWIFLAILMWIYEIEKNKRDAQQLQSLTKVIGK
ncbi:MAG: O-antigen ligase family protein [Candidatus Hodarchaeota archaeon]